MSPGRQLELKLPCAASRRRNSRALFIYASKEPCHVRGVQSEWFHHAFLGREKLRLRGRISESLHIFPARKCKILQVCYIENKRPTLWFPVMVELGSSARFQVDRIAVYTAQSSTSYYFGKTDSDWSVSAPGSRADVLLACLAFNLSVARGVHRTLVIRALASTSQLAQRYAAVRG
jgi:hypothetical protein